MDSGSHDLVVVYSDVRPMMASMVANRLCEEGIDARVVNDSLQMAAGDLPMGWAIAPRVVVFESDEEAAREIIRRYQSERHDLADTSAEELATEAPLPVVARPSGKQRTGCNAGRSKSCAHTQRGTHEDDEDEAEDPQELLVAAACPSCSQPRVATCPICHTSAKAFPLAYNGEPDDDEGTAMALCPTCDEPFRPEYLRRCEWCGYDFGTGIEPAQQEIVEYLNDRTMVAVMGMAAAILAIFAYFAFLLR